MGARACRKCGKALETPQTGRPPSYCSVGCRRAVEYELRRVQKHLERLEERAETWRPGRERYSYGLKPQEAARLYREAVADIETAEARLRELLDDDVTAVPDNK